MINLKDPIYVIEEVKKALSELIINEDIKYLKDISPSDLFRLYSADLCTILLNYFPGATVMMNKNFRECALMIQGVIYNSKGTCDPRYYFAAGNEEINFIKMSFPKLSDDVFDKLNNYLFSEEKTLSYHLRKSINKLT